MKGGELIMQNKKMTFSLPKTYDDELSRLSRLNNWTKRETFMFMIDNFQQMDQTDLKAENRKLKEQIEFTTNENRRILHELEKQTMILNQMLYAFIPNSDEYSDELFPTHFLIEKWEQIERNK